MFSNTKKLIRLIHLWLGFSSGLVVFIIAITGVLWTFELELSNAFYSYRNVEVEPNKEIISIQEIKEIASPHLSKLNSISYYGPDRSIEVRDWTRIDGKLINNYVYINPYSGKILAVRKNDPTFFDIVLELHTNLMLGEFGAQLVRFATLIFLILIISGIYLWWPRNKNGLKQRLKFDWKKSTKWKRKNYDLHNILGFYSSWIIIFVVITGLAWTFNWVDKTIYGVATMGEEYKDYPTVNSVSSLNQTTQTDLDDLVLNKSRNSFKEQIESWYYYLPQNKQESISLYLNPDRETWHKATVYFYDQRTGKLLYSENPQSMNNGQFIRNMYYDIHIGKVLGLPGQLLVFFASLIVASLPITGFYIWYGRKYKNR